MNIYINKHLLGQAILCGIIDICSILCATIDIY